MASGKWVSYLRVSTGKQGAHGLGIEAQRNGVANYLNGGRWTLLQEFVEVESGAKSDMDTLGPVVPDVVQVHSSGR
jgi:DNA invertase Pin-like site-specific DNA recombinase